MSAVQDTTAKRAAQLRCITPADVSVEMIDPVIPCAREQAAAIIASVTSDGYAGLEREAVRLGDIPQAGAQLIYTKPELKRAFDALPRDARPANDDQKRDQWMVRMSNAVQRNLGPFFDAWGVPVSDAAKESIASMDPWMPPDWPQ